MDIKEINLSLNYTNLYQFRIKDNFICFRFIEDKKERFELEFNLEIKETSKEGVNSSSKFKQNRKW